MKKFLTFFIIFIFLFFILRGWWNFQFSPVSKNSQSNNFIIQKGESLSQIADKLQQEKLIRSGWALKLLFRSKNIDNIQAGTFKLSSSMSAEEIIKVLQGGSNDAWVTFIEGWRKEEMAEKLSPKRLGLTIGLFAAICHLVWSIAVALGIQKFVDWILLLHSIKLDLVLTNVVILNVILLVIAAFIGGYIFGVVFALVYNYAGKCKWCK